MFDNLIWGGKVLRLMGMLKGDDHKVAVIRHSERPAFDNLPYPEWDNAELTDRGAKAAFGFGTAVASSQNPECLLTLWCGLKRCKLTAEAFSEGARQEGCLVQGPSAIALKSPIAKREEYEKVLHSGQWNQFITNWLQNERPQAAMVSARQYARDIYRSLLATELCSPDKITIIVTHDLHIMPLAKLFFPSSSPWVDYLDGIVLKVEKGRRVTIGFDEEIVSLNLDESFLI